MDRPLHNRSSDAQIRRDRAKRPHDLGLSSSGRRLQHGADINTRWSTHEPASILHELVFRDDYEGMQFLIDRGIDMTIEDYRWGGTAADWAEHAKKDPKMVQWLEDAERRQKERR